MERYPLVTINKEKLTHNAKAAIEMTVRRVITPVAVTKLFQGEPEIVQILLDAGIISLGDSRIQNLIKMKDLKAEKILLRLPMKNEIDQFVEFADISLNSEVDTIGAISNYCLEHNKKHNIVLMLDIGDRHEGILEEDLDETVERILKFKGVELVDSASISAAMGNYTKSGSNEAILSI